MGRFEELFLMPLESTKAERRSKVMRQHVDFLIFNKARIKRGSYSNLNHENLQRSGRRKRHPSEVLHNAEL